MENLTREAAESLEGKKLPVTVEINGTKQTIGEATLSVVDDDNVHVHMTIKKEFSGLVTPDMRHFALVDTDYRDLV